MNYHEVRSINRIASALFKLAVFAMIPVSAQGATYYVAKTGSDATTCTQARVQQTPKLTVTGGVSCMVGGDTLIILNGIYTEGAISRIPGGSAGAPTIIKAQNRNQAILRPSSGFAVFWLEASYITIDGVDADCVNVTSGSCGPYLHNNAYAPTNITLQHGTARNAKGIYGSGIELGHGGHHLIWDMDVINNGTDKQFDHGIYVYGSNVTIDGNRIRGSAGWGIHVYHGCDGKNGCPSTGIVIRNNTVYSNSNRSALLITQAAGTLIYNNILYSNGADGVELYGSGVSGTQIYNNTIYGNGRYCVHIPDAGSSTTSIRNNICYRNASDSILDQGSSTTKSSNLMANASFTNAPSGDFHIEPGSPAIAGGENLSTVFTADFEGRARPVASAWDVGALVFSATASAPPPPTNPPTAPVNLRLAGSTN